MAGSNMSGAHGQRQKMINLMYLVFIAMLAMQIDQEIIRSYQDTNKSLEETRLLTEEKNTKIFERTLAAKAASSPETFGAANQSYQELKTRVNDLVSFVEQKKVELRKNAGFDDATTNVEDNFTALNNTQPSTEMFFKGGAETQPSEVSAELKKKMEGLRQYLNQNFAKNPDMQGVVARANQTLVTEFPKGEKRNNKNWLQYKFYNQPLIAAMSNLEVIQSEARNLQSDALAMMLQEKVDADIKFNSYEAIVAAPSTVIAGQPAEARVFIGTGTAFPVTISGVDRQQNGQGYKALGTSSVGTQSFQGKISFTDLKGKTIELPFNHTYNVIAGAEQVKLQSGALVSADKMNVLYRGVDNPVSGSILGADNSRVSLSAPGASVSGGSGRWVVRPGGGNTVNITISGQDPSGKTISQAFPFRIKSVPAPQGQIRGQNELSMPASSIANQTVSAAIPDFDFPVSFNVTGFKFKVPGRAAMFVSGSNLGSVSSLTKNLRSGDIVYIAGIQATATGLGGQTLKNISPIVINVQ